MLTPSDNYDQTRQDLEGMVSDWLVVTEILC